MKITAAAAAGFGMGFALLAGVSGASAETLPTMRGVDHTGVTVTDTEAAVAFFEEVIGCEALLAFGPFSDPEGGFMRDLLNVHPRAVINRITVLRCGDGSSIELLEYESPGQQTRRPRNSDVGGHHIAFYVDDIEAAASWLNAHEVETFFGPLHVTEGPAAGQSIMYFRAPWGLYMELISYPEGMAYEADSGRILWSPGQAH